MKALPVLLLLALIVQFCNGQPNPKVWTKKYEQGLYHYLDSVSKQTMPGDSIRSKYISFVVKRIKEEVPNGLNSVSKDSLHNLNIRIGREYALKEKEEGNNGEFGLVPKYERWTPLIEKTFRDDFYAVFRKMGGKMNDKFCNCFIEKLKKIYPDSVLIPVPREVNNKVAVECRGSLEQTQ